MLKLNMAVMQRLRCSRREADKYIMAGNVQVDGRHMVLKTNFSTKVAAATAKRRGKDTFSGSTISSSHAEPDYNEEDCYGSVGLTDLGQKEVGKVQSVDDKNTILFFRPRWGKFPNIRMCTKEREHPQPVQNNKRAWYEPTKACLGPPQQQSGWMVAGREYMNLFGLGVLTRSRGLAAQIWGNPALYPPIEKAYVVRIPQLKSDPSCVVEEKLRQLREGVCPRQLREGVCPPDGSNQDDLLTAVRVEQINENQVRFVTDHERWNHLYRMCQAVQWDVARLKRYRIGNVVLGDLPVGFWRYLRPDESFR
jgi:16S rRNA U516 pseudouridylate synthase RsuA-like enzyme